EGREVSREATDEGVGERLPARVPGRRQEVAAPPVFDLRAAVDRVDALAERRRSGAERGAQPVGIRLRTPRPTIERRTTDQLRRLAATVGGRHDLGRVEHELGKLRAGADLVEE